MPQIIFYLSAERGENISKLKAVGICGKKGNRLKIGIFIWRFSLFSEEAERARPAIA
jgi:hypothetical protein